MNNILDEEIAPSTPSAPKRLPKYMRWWHLVLMGLLVFNHLIGAYQWHPLFAFQGVLMPYVFLCLITGFRFWRGRIIESLKVSFLLLGAYVLGSSLYLLGNGLFMWMVVHMGTVAR